MSSPWRWQDYWPKHVGEYIINKQIYHRIKVHLFVVCTVYKSCQTFSNRVCTSHIQFMSSYVARAKYKIFMSMVCIVTTMLYGDKFNVDFVLWWLAWPFTFGNLLLACWYCYCHVLRAVGIITTLLVAKPRVYFLNQWPRQVQYCGCISIWDRIYIYILYGDKDREDQLGRSCEKWSSVTESQGGEECRVNSKK